MPLLSLRGLRVSVDDKEVVKGFDLTVKEGEIHAIMGPNGSGKSTLVNTLMGHPKYTVTGGDALLDGKDLIALSASDRAHLGLFLAFQYPKEIAGVTLRSFLFASHTALTAARDPKAKKLSPLKFRALLEAEMKRLHMDVAFAERFVNQGFSGGEKKKAEVLQMALLKPRLALLDETDSGLDIDALKVVSEGVNRMRLPTGASAKGGSHPFSAIIVTHYARILDYIRPDHVHVMVAGTIRESGGMELAKRLEKEGYAKYGVQEDGPSLTLEIGD